MSATAAIVEVSESRSPAAMAMQELWSSGAPALYLIPAEPGTRAYKGNGATIVSVNGEQLEERDVLDLASSSSALVGPLEVAQEVYPLNHAAASVPLHLEFSAFRGPLKPELAADISSYLNGNVKKVYERICTLSLEQANRMGVAIRHIRVFSKRRWEEDFREIVVQLFVEANLPQSLALWDSIGAALARWQGGQTRRVREVLAEEFAVFVEPYAE